MVALTGFIFVRRACVSPTICGVLIVYILNNILACHPERRKQLSVVFVVEPDLREGDEH